MSFSSYARRALQVMGVEVYTDGDLRTFIERFRDTEEGVWALRRSMIEEAVVRDITQEEIALFEVVRETLYHSQIAFRRAMTRVFEQSLPMPLKVPELPVWVRQGLDAPLMRDPAGDAVLASATLPEALVTGVSAGAGVGTGEAAAFGRLAQRMGARVWPTVPDQVYALHGVGDCGCGCTNFGALPPIPPQVLVVSIAAVLIAGMATAVIMSGALRDLLHSEDATQVQVAGEQLDFAQGQFDLMSERARQRAAHIAGGGTATDAATLFPDPPYISPLALGGMATGSQVTKVVKAVAGAGVVVGVLYGLYYFTVGPGAKALKS